MIYHDRNHSCITHSLNTIFVIQTTFSDKKQRRSIWTNLYRKPVREDK